jgi:FdrA protein
MSTFVLNDVRKGFYLDSVALMRMSRVLAEMPEIDEAAMMMATPPNRKILAEAGLLAEAGAAAGGGDLIIGVRATTREAGQAALAEANAQLDRPANVQIKNQAWQPKNLQAALKISPHANLTLISVPGEFAVAEARKAIRHGLHAMIFSDNVDVDEELELKREARERGRLVMGPDCGTAIIAGTPLAFANVVPRGEIGIVGASGTGTQEVACLIGQYGGGISHAIGVGGRDLNSEIGGISTLMALDALDADPITRKVVIITKPPPTDVAAIVLERIASSEKSAIVCFVGADEMPMPANATQVFSLKAAALAAMGRPTDEKIEPPSPINAASSRPVIQGLFSGGTLCAEAQALLRAAGAAVRSNAPIPGVPHVDETETGHSMIDLGDDRFTRGKPHPMIEPSVRDDAMAAALTDESNGVVLLDVVIGYGAHSDPADHLVQFLEKHRKANGPEIIASVTGTDADPQNRSTQINKLVSAGVHVAPTNADAARWALSAVRT